MTSGRTPRASRKATSSRPVMATTEYAPTSRGITLQAADSRLPGSAASIAAMISESVLACRSAPPSVIWSRRAPVLVRLPLWPSATSPPLRVLVTGWALSHLLPPVVE